MKYLPVALEADREEIFSGPDSDGNVLRGLRVGAETHDMPRTKPPHEHSGEQRLPPSGKMLRKEAGVIRVLNMLRESDRASGISVFAAKRPTLAAEFTREICRGRRREPDGNSF